MAWLPLGRWDLSSQTRDQTRVPCIGRQILNHWITRVVPRLSLIKETQISQVKEFSAFLCIHNLSLLKYPFDMRLSHLGPASCASHLLSPQGATPGGWVGGGDG